MKIISDAEYLRRALARERLDIEAQGLVDRAMLEAVSAGHKRDAEYLLRMGANPNACDEYGRSGFELVTGAACLLTLLEGRADPALAFPNGGIERLMMFYINNYHENLANILLDYCKIYLDERASDHIFNIIVSTKPQNDGIVRRDFMTPR